MQMAGDLALAKDGRVNLGEQSSSDGIPIVAIVPPCRPSALGDRSFASDHGLRFCYVAGAMANGIASAKLVEAMGRAGMLGFFGAAGLAPDVVDDAIERISTRLVGRPWGFNLIHSPYEPHLEQAIVDLYIRRGVRLVSASAYLGLTLPLLRYRTHGIRVDSDGTIVTPNRVIAKVSRIEVATKFFAPPPAQMLQELVAAGDLTHAQAKLASLIPVAQDMTAEADSAGHTDNRPALTLLPTMLSLRDRMQAQHRFAMPLRVGVAGGISTPYSAAAAFAMGAAFVLTGSMNQACREAGTSDEVRQMLAQTQQADVTMAPAADMFEMGVKVQVLKRGTMFAMRAGRLYDLYRSHDSLDSISATQQATLEKTVFRASLAEIWAETQRFWSQRDPAQIELAERDSKHKMALVFRWYLGRSSHWANTGQADRRVDYQVWCGPAMGAFNEWARGSVLERWSERNVVTVAHNILHGAAVLTRLASLRSQGVGLPGKSLESHIDLAPRLSAELEEYMQ